MRPIDCEIFLSSLRSRSRVRSSSACSSSMVARSAGSGTIEVSSRRCSVVSPALLSRSSRCCISIARKYSSCLSFMYSASGIACSSSSLRSRPALVFQTLTSFGSTLRRVLTSSGKCIGNGRLGAAGGRSRTGRLIGAGGAAICFLDDFLGGGGAGTTTTGAAALGAGALGAAVLGVTVWGAAVLEVTVLGVTVLGGALAGGAFVGAAGLTATGFLAAVFGLLAATGLAGGVRLIGAADLFTLAATALVTGLLEMLAAGLAFDGLPALALGAWVLLTAGSPRVALFPQRQIRSAGSRRLGVRLRRADCSHAIGSGAAW